MDSTPIPDHPFRIGFLLIDGFALMSYSSVSEPLRAANLLAGKELYEIRHASLNGEQATSSNGAVIKATIQIDEPNDFDLLLVSAGGDPATFQDTRIFNWLRQLARHGVRLGGISGGPVILASAGLMEGRRMTVHWEHAQALAESYPSLMLERSLYVIDRDRITCAGGTAPMDMIHALLTEHHGSDFARKVSDWFMHTDIRPSASPQRAGLVERYSTSSPSVIHAIEAMENHIADPLDLGQLAMLSRVSPRQLNRLFYDKLGQSTMTVYRDLRLEKARNLLLQSVLSITEIALATGFSSSAHFSKSFRDKYDVTPSTLRLSQSGFEN